MKKSRCVLWAGKYGTYPLIQRNISEDSYLQQHQCANLK